MIQTRLSVWLGTGWFPVILAVLVTAGYAIFPSRSQSHFLSPDETANAAFARQYAATGSLRLAEPLNPVADGIIHPRSVAVSGTSLLPGSFIAFPVILGSLARVFGVWMIQGGGLLFFACSIVAVWVIGERWFGRPAAVVSTLVYALNPAVAFYAMRGLWHNGLLTSLLLIGWALWVLAARRQSRWLIVAGALSVSMAIAMRPSELIWIVAFSVSWLVGLRPLPRWSWRLTLSVAAVVALRLFLLQSATFGSAGASGYESVSEDGGAVTPFLARSRAFFFPFGFHPGQALSLFWSLTTTVLGPAVMLGLLGIGVTLIRRNAVGRSLRFFAFGAFAVVLWLVLSYGSFSLIETFDREHLVLGSSYLRYWLPGLALLAVFVAPAWSWLSARQSVPSSLLSLLLAVILALSLQQSVGAVALPLIPTQAVVFAGTDDKVFFPERRVAGYNHLTLREVRAAIALVRNNSAVFFVTGQREDLAFMTENASQEQVRLTPVSPLPGGTTLFRLNAEEEEEART